MGTLRLRLALWHALALSAILAVFAALIYGVVREELIRHHDASLTETARSVEHILSSEADCETLTEAQRGKLERLGPLVLVHEIGGERRSSFSPSTSAGSTRLSDRSPIKPRSRRRAASRFWARNPSPSACTRNLISQGTGARD